MLTSSQGWKYSRDNGCQPPLHSVSHGPFGISMILSLVKAGREYRFTELIRGWHRAYGTTFKANMGGRKAIFTAEPKNIQAVLAHKFKDFELGSIRNEAARPLLGSNVFTTDGSEWEHSRAMLRPNFSRTRVSDTDIYESHVAKLIKHIPRDGSTVDLQNLFLRMVIVLELHSRVSR
jgi:cytochrome P450